jgi:hypothetical protein
MAAGVAQATSGLVGAGLEEDLPPPHPSEMASVPRSKSRADPFAKNNITTLPSAVSRNSF